jgi:hypothetical protein
MCPATHEAVELIEPSIHGVVFFRESEMPLAEGTRDITGWLESLREKHFVEWNA